MDIKKSKPPKKPRELQFFLSIAIYILLLCILMLLTIIWLSRRGAAQPLPPRPVTMQHQTPSPEEVQTEDTVYDEPLAEPDPEEGFYELIPFGLYEEILSIWGNAVLVRHGGEYALLSISRIYYANFRFGVWDAIGHISNCEVAPAVIVSQGPQYGALSITGAEQIPLGMFDTVWASYDGKYIVSDYRGFALIDRWLDFDELIPFGMFERLWGISGNYVIEGPAGAPDDFTGRSVVRVTTLYEDIIEVISPDMHEEIVSINDGLVTVRNDGIFSVISTENQELLSFDRNTSIVSVSETMIAIEQNGEYAIVDLNGDELIPFGKYERISSVAWGRAIVYKNGSPGVIQVSVLDGLFYSECGGFSVRFMQEGNSRELVWYENDVFAAGNFRENRDGSVSLIVPPSYCEELFIPVSAKPDAGNIIVWAYRGYNSDRLVEIPLTLASQARLNPRFDRRFITPEIIIYYSDDIWFADGIVHMEIDEETIYHLISAKVISIIAGLEWARYDDGRETLHDRFGNMAEFWPNRSYARVNGEYVDIMLADGELVEATHDGEHHLFIPGVFFNIPEMRPFGVGVVESYGTATIMAR